VSFLVISQASDNKQKVDGILGLCQLENSQKFHQKENANFLQTFIRHFIRIFHFKILIC